MTVAPLNVLILCTGNSARSILSEAYLRHVGKDRFGAYSAGSKPVGQVNSLAIATLKGHDISVDGLRSKSWEDFSGPNAPRMDIILTVCDSAAGETCPIWPGHPVTAHWGLPDPAAATGAEEDKRAAFEAVFVTIRALIDDLVSQTDQALSPDRRRETLGAVAARHLPEEQL